MGPSIPNLMISYRDCPCKSSTYVQIQDAEGQRDHLENRDYHDPCSQGYKHCTSTAPPVGFISGRRGLSKGRLLFEKYQSTSCKKAHHYNISIALGRKLHKKGYKTLTVQSMINCVLCRSLLLLTDSDNKQCLCIDHHECTHVQPFRAPLRN